MSKRDEAVSRILKERAEETGFQVTTSGHGMLGSVAVADRKGRLAGYSGVPDDIPIIVNPGALDSFELDISKLTKDNVNRRLTPILGPQGGWHGSKREALEITRLFATDVEETPEVESTSQIESKSAAAKSPSSGVFQQSAPTKSTPAPPVTPKTSAVNAGLSLFKNTTGEKTVSSAADGGSAVPLKPHIEVVFEVEGMPFQQTAYYHRVVRDKATLVLVFDTRAEGCPKIFPQPTSQKVAMQIAGQDSVYIVVVPDIHFKLDDYEIHVLLIEQEHPA